MGLRRSHLGRWLRPCTVGHPGASGCRPHQTLLWDGPGGKPCTPLRLCTAAADWAASRSCSAVGAATASDRVTVERLCARHGPTHPRSGRRRLRATPVTGPRPWTVAERTGHRAAGHRRLAGRCPQPDLASPSTGSAAPVDPVRSAREVASASETTRAKGSSDLKASTSPPMNPMQPPPSTPSTPSWARRRALSCRGAPGPPHPARPPERSPP